MNNFSLIFRLIPLELLNTLYMVFISAFFSFLIGLPLGIFLYLTNNERLCPSVWIHRLLEMIVNIGRSIPFAILIVAIIPFTRFLVGTSIGTTASIVPLTVAAAPFMARIVEGALKEVGGGVVQAAIAMGASTLDVVLKVLLPEALPTLVRGGTLTLVTLVGYSALAGLVGGGGLGKVAIQYGYHRFNGVLMGVTLIILVLLVECIQKIGNKIAIQLEKKRGLI